MSLLNVKHVKTVIIGAGMSGIGASINLLQNNYEDFIVIEALERIGGRVCTQISENGYLELGAQWIHGQEGNPIYECAQKHGLVRQDFAQIINVPVEKINDKNNFRIAPGVSSLKKLDIRTHDEAILFATQYGKHVNFELGQSIYDTITKIISSASYLELVSGTKSENRYGDYLWENFIHLVKKELNNSQLSDFELRRIFYGLFLMRSKRENIRNGTSNVFDLSLKHFSAYKEFKGHSYVELNKGFLPIIEKLIGHHRENFNKRVHLRQYLKKIILSKDFLDYNPNLFERNESLHAKYTNNDKSKIVLLICDDSNPNKPNDYVIVCDHVLCTFSLGYLKENLNSFIEPINLISNERRLAVSRLGFGTINKIFLFYEKPFWSDKVQLINMIWLPDTDDFCVDKLIYRNSNKKNWFEEICKFEVVNSMPNALSGWLAGSEDFERLDDEAIAKECTRLLRLFLGDETIPFPKSILRTKWNMNRFSKGSYSHIPLGAEPSDIENLAKPIPSFENPMVLFAGEATEKDFFSTVHGAYISGIRESDRLLKYRRLLSKI